MLTDELKQTIQRAYSSILKQQSLQTRPGQKRMIAEIARSLCAVEQDAEGHRQSDEPGVCVVEAGTGTGKTLAYLVAALPVAQALDKKLVIATATVALQEQVLFKDIPSLLQHSDLRFTYALAKGRGRYLCLAKLDNLLRHSGNASLDALRDMFQTDIKAQGETERALYENMLEQLSSGAWQGDRDDWPQVLDDNTWRAVAVEHGQCAGNRCSYFSTCCYFRSRNDLDKVDCVVANHDLVLSDLALGGGVILPSPADTIYVFDEAHQLPGKGINHFTHQVKLGSSAQWLEQLSTQMQRGAAQLSEPSRLAPLLREAVDLAQSAQAAARENLLLLQAFAERAESSSARGETAQFVFTGGVAPPEVCTALDALGQDFARLAAKLDKVVATLKDNMEGEGGEVDKAQAETWFLSFGAAQVRVEAAALCCLHFSRADAKGAIPEARWLVFHDEIYAGAQQDVSLFTSPVLAAAALQEHLWNTCYGAVLTSATLSTLGNFAFLAERCGLPPSSDYHRIQSPFSYQQAAILRLPKQGFDPSDTQAHTRAIIELLPRLLTEPKGALVLFSSRRQLLDVAEGLDPLFRRKVLAQDDYSKQELLRLHKEAVDKGQASIIFGLASLAEGIDLPGDYCTHVVIAKIPFPVPNDPVDATLGEWVKAQGRNPFQEISVPEAALRLVQASGRLLRRESDRGHITILDQRLSTRSYGRAILDSLPPYPREYF
ncbi:MAG: ATP-dependent DNA helicase DinG [Pseudomonadales bacterium]|jgi:ATP-dependent DNA helicase DinG|nr:ATP-dependent DNA helicase DinG [Pseudomonadales bacterium]